MPISRIDVIKSRSNDEAQAIINALHTAQVEVLKVPAHDRQIRYIEHKPEHFAIPPGKTDNYTLIELCIFPGRSRETKKALYQAIVSNLGKLGVEPSDIFIVLHEPPLDNWGIRGGQIASEVDFGYPIVR